MVSKKNPLKKALARPGDPLVTERGLAVLPDRRRNEEPVPPSDIDVKDFKSSQRRTLKELPAPVTVLNGIGCIILYSVLGLSDREICSALKIGLGDLKTMRNHSAYAECFGIFADEFVNANSDLLAARLAAYANSALDVVADLSQKANKQETQLKASIDLMDRGGIGAKELANKRGSTGKDLRIVILDGEVSSTTIEINPSQAA